MLVFIGVAKRKQVLLSDLKNWKEKSTKEIKGNNKLGKIKSTRSDNGNKHKCSNPNLCKWNNIFS